MSGSNAQNKIDNSQAKKMQDASALALSSPELQKAIAAYKQSGNIDTALNGVHIAPKANTTTGTGNVNWMTLMPPGVSPSDPSYAMLEKSAKEQAAAANKSTETSIENPDQSTLDYALRNALLSDPEVASALATSKTQNDPLLSGLFGKGGIQDLRQQQEKDLTANGFNWNDQDETAFGQAAGNIARQGAAEQNQLARALANRGFGASDSGIANSQFAGLAGNTSERLAQQQMQLANNRMNFNLNALNNARTAVNQIAGIGQGAQNQNFNQNMASLGRGDQQVQNAFNNAQVSQNQANKEYEQQQESAFNPGKIIGGALTGVGSSILGPIGGAAGTGIANSIFGSDATKQYLGSKKGLGE